MSKYTMLAYTSLLRTEVIKDIFEQRRNYPKILKLMAYGRQDAIFERYLLNGTSYYYTYGQGSLTEDYNKKMCEKYKGLTKFNTTNIQERFVYSFPKASHGVHISRKQPLQNLINLYLSMVLSDEPETPSL